MTEIGYRYDVFVCSNPDTSVGAHDGDCGDWHRIEQFWNYDYIKAFELATTLTHAKVENHSMASGASYTAFEHIAGGGLCADCRAARGPLISLHYTDKFLCDRCRRDHEQAVVRMGLSDIPATYRQVYPPEDAQ